MQKVFLGIDVGTVVFTPGAANAGHIVISGMSGFDPARLLGVTDVTHTALIYIAQGSGYGGAWTGVTGAGGTLTFAADTAAFSAGDHLQIIYAQADTAATAALQTSANALLSLIDSTLTGTLTITGALTDTQLRASAVPVSGTFWQATQPVSGTVTVNAGTNLNTSLLALEGGNLASILTKLNGSLAVTGTFWQATQPVSAASLPLPAGAATAALQTAGNTSLAALALETGGNLASVATSSTAISTNLGAKADSTWDGAAAASAIAILRYVGAKIEAARALLAGTLTATLAAGTALIGLVKLQDSGGNTIDPAKDSLPFLLGSGGTVSSAAVVIPSTDVSKFATVGLQLIANASGNTFSFEGSNDNSNWGPLTSTTNASSTASTTVGAVIWIPVAGTKYFRTRCSTYVSGSLQLLDVYSGGMHPMTTVVSALNTGSNVVGAVSLNAAAGTGIGMSTSRIVTGASGSAKGTAARLFGWHLKNTTASVRYMQIYAKASAGIPGTDTPLFPIVLDANTLGSDINTVMSDVGIAVASGLGWAITTDLAGATIASSGDVVGNLWYA